MISVVGGDCGPSEPDGTSDTREGAPVETEPPQAREQQDATSPKREAGKGQTTQSETDPRNLDCHTPDPLLQVTWGHPVRTGWPWRPQTDGDAFTMMLSEVKCQEIPGRSRKGDKRPRNTWKEGVVSGLWLLKPGRPE